MDSVKLSLKLLVVFIIYICIVFYTSIKTDSLEELKTAVNACQLLNQC